MSRYSPRYLTVDSAESALQAWGEGVPRPLVDLSRLVWFDAFGIVLLILQGRRCQEAGGLLRVLLPNQEAVRLGLAQTGAFTLLEGAYWTDGHIPEIHDIRPEFALVRVRKEEEVGGLVDGLADRLATRFPFGERANRVLVGATVELLQNIPQHAAAGRERLDPFGLAAIQEESDHIHLVVADKGVGLAGSLALNPRYGGISGAEALEAIIVGGVSRFDEPGRGGALKKIREVVRDNAGRFYVRSGTGAFLQEDVEWSVGEVMSFPGVQISIRLPRRLFEGGEG